MSQIGNYPGAGSAGWVFKVNGVSPPVGADQVQLKDGDSVLWYWAVFGPNGGPATLDLKADGPNCYQVRSFDDTGKAVRLRPPSCTSTAVGSRPRTDEDVWGPIAASSAPMPWGQFAPTASGSRTP